VSFGDYLENALLDHIFGKATFTAPTIFVGLSTVDPGDDGTNLAEPSGGSYARVETAASDWNSASGGVITNAEDIVFPTPTGDWGTMRYAVLFDAASEGNILAVAAITIPETVTLGSTGPIFFAGFLRARLF